MNEMNENWFFGKWKFGRGCFILIYYSLPLKNIFGGTLEYLLRTFCQLLVLVLCWTALKHENVHLLLLFTLLVIELELTIKSWLILLVCFMVLLFCFLSLNFTVKNALQDSYCPHLMMRYSDQIGYCCTRLSMSNSISPKV